MKTYRNVKNFIMHNKIILINSSINLFGIIVPAFFAILCIPILLENLGDKYFGIFSIQIAVLILIGITDFGIARAVILEAVAKGGFNSVSVLRQVVWAGTELIIIVAMAVMGIGGIVLTVAFFVLPMSVHEGMSWGLLLPAAAISLVAIPARAALEVEERFVTANIIRAGGSTLLFAAPAIVSFYFSSTTATTSAMLVSRVLVSGATLIASRKLFNDYRPRYVCRAIQQILRNNASILHRNLIRRGGWLGGAGIASNLISYADRFALGASASAAATASYVVASELVTKMWLVTGAITAAVMPRLAYYWREQGDNKFNITINYIFLLQLLLAFSSHLIFVFFGHHLMKLWLNNEYKSEMSSYLSVLSIGISINILSGTNYIILLLHNKEKFVAKIQFMTLVFTLVFSYIAAKNFGAFGVAWVFSLRLLMDAIIIRLYIPQHKNSYNNGINPIIMALCIVAIFLIYWIAQIGNSQIEFS